MRDLHERGLVSRYTDGSEFFDGIAADIPSMTSKVTHDSIEPPVCLGHYGSGQCLGEDHDEIERSGTLLQERKMHACA